MERKKTEIHLDGKRTVTVKLPVDFIDRVFAEGMDDVVMNIDDEKFILVIRPVEK